MTEQAETMMLKFNPQDRRVHMSLQAPEAGAPVATYPISQPMILAMALDYPEIMGPIQRPDEPLFVEPGPLYDELLTLTSPQNFEITSPPAEERIVTLQLRGRPGGEVHLVMRRKDGTEHQVPASRNMELVWTLHAEGKLSEGMLTPVVMAVMQREGIVTTTDFLDRH